MSQLSFQQSCELLVCGYIRRLTKLHKDIIIPKEIDHVILLFYLLDIEPTMIFDSYGMNSSRMQIINDRKAKCIKSYDNNLYGSSIRLKCAMPINAKYNNTHHIKSISWEIKHTSTVSFPNGFYFIGVVSNLVKDFSFSPFQFGGCMKSAWGILGNPKQVMNGNGVDRRYYKTEQRCKPVLAGKQYEKDVYVKVKYNIVTSELSFTQNKHEICTIPLPMYDKDITHFFPCVGLRDNGDICEISPNVVVE